MIRRRASIRRSSVPLKRISPRQKRKGRRASLSREADRLWSALVKLPGRCEVCGSKERLQAAHGISRRYRVTRWLPINGFCLCARCHMRFTHDPIAWDVYLNGAWGSQSHRDLKDMALTYARQDMKVVVSSLRDELARREVQ